MSGMATPYQVGFAPPALSFPPIDLPVLRRYAEASGDHEPVHVESAFAKSVGFDDVIAHGLLVMAWQGRVVTDWVGSAQLRAWSVRFAAVINRGDALTCTARITSIYDAEGEQRADLELRTTDATGAVKLTGAATVALVPAKPAK